MKKNIGFTLVDLMLVIATIGIILSIVVPAITNKNNQNSQDYQQEKYYNMPSKSN